MFKIWEIVGLSWGREIIEFSRGPAEARSRKAAGRKLDLRALWVLWPSPPPHPAGLVRLSYDNPGPLSHPPRPLTLEPWLAPLQIRLDLSPLTTRARQFNVGR